MLGRHRDTSVAVAARRGVWASNRWRLLGMLFVTALLFASHRVATADVGPVGPPADHITHLRH